MSRILIFGKEQEFLYLFFYKKEATGYFIFLVIWYLICARPQIPL